MTDADRRQRIDDLCHAALDQEAQQRSAFLAAACDDDKALRLEVETLLAFAQTAERFLATPIADVAAEIFDDDRASLVGRQIGAYSILSLLGAGGMGEVYRARDTKLGRDVAIKVVQDRFLAIPGRLARFELEARVLATLNHPHIAAIYGLEEADGVRGLVLELVEGPTLGEHLTSGALPVQESLDLARQIAEALEAAHEKGIIHRDLKPANIKITPTGTIKVLDFGLAKVFATEESRQDVSQTPPIAVDHSREGVIAGTTAYMSPEQARGKTVDKRTDIWAFGCVFYEMLTGRPPFEGETSSDTVAAILEHEPDWSGLPAQTPPTIQRLIERCLEKDPKRRWRDIGDAALEIESALDAVVTAGAGTSKDASTDHQKAAVRQARGAWWAIDPIRRRRRLLATGVIALVLGGAVGLMFMNAKRTFALTDRDTLLVADFRNTTGDTVFDGALKQALSIDLEQSPFLSIVSREDVRNTLRLMTKSPDEHVVGDVAREACQRLGAQAMIEGSIARVGSHYAIGLDALDCQSAKTVASEQAVAARREEVLTVLSTVASTMRHNLGESLPTIQRFDVPIDQATTSSLEALKAFSAAEEVRGRSSAGAVPFYTRAIEIDPNFALAYTRLSAVYGSLGEISEMQRTSEEAYARRDRASERERFYIDGRHCAASADPDCFINVNELWKRTYPRDGRLDALLSGVYWSRGECDQTLANSLGGLQIDPGYSEPYLYLAQAYLCLGKPTDARQTLERAISRHLESPAVYLGLLIVAFHERDENGIARVRQWATGRPEEAVFAAFESDEAAFSGRMRVSRQARMRAERVPAAHLNDRLKFFRALGAVYEAARGDFGRARTITRAMTAQSPNSSVIPVLLAAAVLSHDFDQADALVRQTERQAKVPALGPLGSLARVLRDLDGGDRSAVDRLPPAMPTDVTSPHLASPAESLAAAAYLRGLVYLHAQDGVKAAAEFQRMLEKPSWGWPLRPLAYVQQARAYALSGDQVKARKAYEDFFALWKDADPDIPILQEAKAEYARLTALPQHRRWQSASGVGAKRHRG